MGDESRSTLKLAPVSFSFSCVSPSSTRTSLKERRRLLFYTNDDDEHRDRLTLDQSLATPEMKQREMSFPLEVNVEDHSSSHLKNISSATKNVCLAFAMTRPTRFDTRDDKTSIV